MKIDRFRNFFIHFLRVILTICGTALLVSCGSSGTGGSTNTGSYNLAIKVTDASGCDFQSVVVTVDQVALNTRLNASKDDADWITVTLNPPVTFDLLQLQNGNTLNLASLKIPPGTYQSILLSLVPNSLGANTLNDYVTLISNPGQKLPLSLPSGFPNRVAINFNKAVTVSSNGTISNIVIDFDACSSVVTLTDAQGNTLYILKPRLMEVNEDASGGIVGTITTSSLAATAPEHLVVKAEVKGEDGNYHVVRQTSPNPDGSFKLFPLEFDDDSQGVYDVVVVSDNYGTVAIQDVAVPPHDDAPLSATSFATIGTVKLDTLALPAVTWSTTGTFTGTIMPRGIDVRIRETVGERTYEVRRHHADLQSGVFTFPLSWGATTSAKYTTGTMTFTADSLTTAGSYTADTPTGDWDNDDRTEFENTSFPFRITDGTKALTIIHDFILVPAENLVFPLGSLTSSVSGTVTATNLPVNDVEKVFVVALINENFVAGIDEVDLSNSTNQAPYTINYLPVGATVTIDAFNPDFEPTSSESITVLKGFSITLNQGPNTGPNFTLTEP